MQCFSNHFQILEIYLSIPLTISLISSQDLSRDFRNVSKQFTFQVPAADHSNNPPSPSDNKSVRSSTVCIRCRIKCIIIRIIHGFEQLTQSVKVK